MPYRFKSLEKTQPTDVPKPVVDAICFQVNKEIYSQYLYNSMGACFQSRGLPGMARWMYKQAREEQEHAFKFIEWLALKGQRIHLSPIDEPEKQWWENPVDAFKHSLEHEKLVTSLIHQLNDKISPFSKDHPELKIDELMKWFIDEQTEEEQSVADVIAMFGAVDKKEKTMEELDAEIAKMRQEKC